jgi:hypothetical protein
MTELLTKDTGENAPVPVATAPAGQRPRRHPWAWVVTFACVALLGIALGYLLENAAQANHAYDQARASLVSARDRASLVSHELARARTDLALLTRQVGNDTTALSQDTSELQGARAALSAADNHVSQQATLLTSLNRCLGGVEQALNALSVGNPSSAVAALDGVSQSCSAAVAASG